MGAATLVPCEELGGDAPKAKGGRPSVYGNRDGDFGRAADPFAALSDLADWHCPQFGKFNDGVTIAFAKPARPV